MNRFYKILKIICSLIFIFSVVHKSIFAAQIVTPMDIYQGTPVQYDNQYLTLYTQQYNLQGEFASRLLAVKQDPSAMPFVKKFAQTIGNLGSQNKFIYLVKAPDSTTYYSWYTGFKDAFTVSYSQYVKVGDYIYNDCPIVTGPVYRFAYWNSSGIISNQTTQSTMSIPYAMTNVFNPAFIEVFRAFGMYETEFESDVREILETIASNSASNYQLALNQINDSINDQTDTLHNDLSDVQNTISETNDKIDETNDKIDETNDKLDDINNTLTDDTVDSSAEDLPSVSVDDPTSDGIGGIFQSIYNAFCTGNAQDIVFPIPFTNKNITLSPSYVSDMLSNNNAGWVLTLIQVFWGYLIGRFIVSDISKKIDKIKSGDIENIQNDNIKEEML